MKVKDGVAVITVQDLKNICDFLIKEKEKENHKENKKKYIQLYTHIGRVHKMIYNKWIISLNGTSGEIKIISLKCPA